jgi:hypothetical protein
MQASLRLRWQVGSSHRSKAVKKNYKRLELRLPPRTDLLRLLFSRAGTPHVGPGYFFSFNTPQGMCTTCEGIGRTVQLDPDRFLDPTKSLNSGAILHPEFAVGKWMWKMYPLSGLFDPD